MNYRMKALCAVRILFLFLTVPVTLPGQPTGDEAKRKPRVSVGLDVLLDERLEWIQGKQIAIVTNHTGRNAAGERIADLLGRHATVVALLGPEHGLEGVAPDGVSVPHSKEPLTGVPVFSLYGEFRTPTTTMLNGAELVVYDIQDIGAKFYTYISTLYLTLQACARDRIPVVVLDRPNPISGQFVEGPVTHPAFLSFVGIAPICIRHGMTVGELALMFNTEHFIGHTVGARVQVVPMRGWTRRLWYDQTGLPWIPPSPNMPTLDTATVYPGACLFEATNISEGRGTPRPFQIIGAPWIDGQRWADDLNSQGLPGVVFSATTFVPIGIENKAPNPKYADETCQGVYVKVTAREIFRPVSTGVAMLSSVKKLFPQSLEINKYIDRLWGSERLRELLETGADWRSIMDETRTERDQFLSIRANYLLYR